MNHQKQHKRYIPKLIKNELDKLDYPRKDNLYVILDLVHRKEIYYKSDYQDKYGYTEIAIAQFKSLLPSSDYFNEDMQFLVDQKLLLRNDYFIIGVQPKSYKIPQECLGEMVPITIQDKNINKRISKQMGRNKKLKVKNLEFAKTEYYKNFRIDTVGAKLAIKKKVIEEIKQLCTKIGISLGETDITDIIECKNSYKINRFKIIMNKDGKHLDNIIHRYMVYSTRTNAINDGFLFFKRNDTNGRLDSNLTSLPSFLRPFLTSKETLMNVDIINSQPYFLFTLIKDNSEIEKNELTRYTELVINGKLYEYLMDEYMTFTGYLRTRKQIKRMLFRIYYSENGSFQPLKNFYGKLFPTIMKFINKTNSSMNNTLAIELQHRESDLVLDVIMPLLEQKGIRPYTIHDSFICKESDAKTIKDIFTSKLVELYGIAPSLKLEYLVPEVLEDTDEIVTDWDAFIIEMDKMSMGSDSK